MKFRILILLSLCFFSVKAQYLSTPQDGGNKKAGVSERIGLTDVSVSYDRPALKGREGKIWGQLVHFGYADLGFGTSKAAPWRAGANENTIISLSTDVKIEGKDLSAGKYALFMAVQENEVTLIFSKNASSWGSYFYDQAEDALRVNIKPIKDLPLVERLKFEFGDQTESSATLNLLWEKWKIAFKIEVDLPKTVLASVRNELRNERGFYWQSFQQAATLALKYGSTDEALLWANKAISEPFIGEANFQTLTTKSQILRKLNRNEEADITIKEAIQKGNYQELEQLAKQFASQKRLPEALDVLKVNASKNPSILAANVSLAKGYAALSDFKNATKTAKIAEAQTQLPAEKESIAKMIKAYSEGKESLSETTPKK